MNPFTHQRPHGPRFGPILVFALCAGFASWRGAARAADPTPAAGGPATPAATAAAAADAAKDAKLIVSFEKLEKRIDEMELEGRELQGQFKERMERIEAARRAAAAQAADLRRELGLPKRENGLLGPGGVSGALRRSNFWVGLVLVVVIVAAILFILRIFFGRWGEDEDYSPYIEKENELGSVKYPAAVEEGKKPAPDGVKPAREADKPHGKSHSPEGGAGE